MSDSHSLPRTRMDVSIETGNAPIPGVVYCRETIASSPEEKERIIRVLLERIRDLGLAAEPRELFRYRLCLDEVIQNAIQHGNRNEASKRVEITLFGDDGRWGLVVTDEGDGFDVSAIPDVSSDDALLRENGRGLFILSEYMDTLVYYDGGRTAFLSRGRTNFP